MDLSTETYAIAATLIFTISLLFSMIGLGGGMLYVPVFKWMGLPLKSVAIPLGLLLNAITTFSAFLRYARAGLIAPMLMGMGYPTKEAAGTTAFAVTFSSFSGFLGHMAEGRVDPWLMVLSIVAVSSGFPARGLAHGREGAPRVGEEALRDPAARGGGQAPPWTLYEGLSRAHECRLRSCVFVFRRPHRLAHSSR